MHSFWADELTDEDEKRIIERIVEQVSKRKLWAPAMLLVEMHRPLAYLASQAMVAFSPFVAPFIGIDAVNDYSRLMARPGAMERLVQRIEEEAVESKSAKEPSE